MAPYRKAGTTIVYEKVARKMLVSLTPGFQAFRPTRRR